MTDQHLQRSEAPKPKQTPDEELYTAVAPPVDASQALHFFQAVHQNPFCGQCGGGRLHPIHVQPMKIRLAFRGYVGRVVQFEDRVEIDEAELMRLLPELAEKHAVALARHELHMVEIEFLDEPDPLQRYFRFGSDPPGMVAPIEVKL